MVLKDLGKDPDSTSETDYSAVEALLAKIRLYARMIINNGYDEAVFCGVTSAPSTWIEQRTVSAAMMRCPLHRDHS